MTNDFPEFHAAAVKLVRDMMDAMQNEHFWSEVPEIHVRVNALLTSPAPTPSAPAVDAGARDESDAFEAYYESKGRPVYGNMKAAMRMTWLDARASEATANEPPYAYEIGSRDRTLELVYPAYLERHATDEERALPRLALYTAPPATSTEREALTKADMIELYYIAREKPKSEWMYIVRAALAANLKTNAVESNARPAASGQKLTHRQTCVIERAINYFETIVPHVPGGIIGDLRSLLRASSATASDKEQQS